MKLRIVKLTRYKFLHELQVSNWFWDWQSLMYGSLSECERAMEAYIKHKTIEPVIKEATI